MSDFFAKSLWKYLPVPTFKKYNFSPLSEIEKVSFSGSHFSREKRQLMQDHLHVRIS